MISKVDFPVKMLCSLLALFLISPFCKADEPDPLAGLKPVHPRLLMLEADWKALRAKRETDPELAKVLAKMEADAKWLKEQPPLVRIKTGKRLLDVSRQAVQRIMLWGSIYQLNGDDAYAERAKQELLALAAFEDWNPSHFLDTAEMTNAMALGYDWFYDQLDPETRRIVRKAIVEKGLQPGFDAEEGEGSWHRVENNWNQVCFGGLTMGALAIGDEEPEPARKLLVKARAGIESGLRPYAPSGVYPEGPGYWGYGTVYQVLMLSALNSALGTQWDIEKSPGFLESAASQLQLTGPSGEFFNYSDCDDKTDLQPAMFWFARTLREPGLLQHERKLLEEELAKPVSTEKLYHENRLFTMVALWWSGMPAAETLPKLPLVWFGKGRNPVGVIRSSWTDPNALYLAFKGGAANLSHGHMDAGSFILEADGVRWALDLGRQSYESLESKGVNLWNMAPDSERWSVFRINNRSHNTLTIGDQLHRIDGMAEITEFHEKPEPGGTIDLSPVFKGQADRVSRSFSVGAKNIVSIQDKLSGVAPGTNVRWAMETKAEVTLAGDHAVLKQDGKTLLARVLSPAGARFAVIPASPPEDGFNAQNPGASILIVDQKAQASEPVQFEISLQPGSTAGD